MEIIEHLSQSQKDLMHEYSLYEYELQGTVNMQFDEGETVMEEGAPLRYVLIIESGSVKVSAASSNGKHMILCYYVSSGILGDMELLSREDGINNQVTATSPLSVIAIPYLQNLDALENNHAFIRRLASDTASKLIDSAQYYAESTLLSAEQRLARYILKSSNRNRFSEVMTDVALSTGMSYRHMYRILDSFCKKNLLRKQVYGYDILDPKALEKLSSH